MQHVKSISTVLIRRTCFREATGCHIGLYCCWNKIEILDVQNMDELNYNLLGCKFDCPVPDIGPL